MSSPALNPSGLLEHYAVDLLFGEDAGDVDTVAAAIAKSPEVEVAARENDALTLRQRASPERGAPPEWSLGAPGAVDREAVGNLLEQSWWWRDAETAITACTQVRRLSDHLFVTLDHRRRIRLFQRVLATVLESLPCRAIAWAPTQQVVAPADFLETMRTDGFESPAPGALNVRLFGLDEDGSYVMDTLGLGALGLVDLQCRFRGLDPEEVSHVLQATGIYLWQQGPVIRSGNTVQGPRPADRWTCTTRTAMAEPERELLDLDPGFPFGLPEADEA